MHAVQMAVAIYLGTLSACMHCLFQSKCTATYLGSLFSMHATVVPRCGRQPASTAAQTALLEPTKAGARLKTSGGASHRLVDDAENGLAASVLTAPPAGPLVDAALFIDQNAQQLKTAAATEHCWWGGRGWGWRGGWGPGWGWCW